MSLFTTERRRFLRGLFGAALLLAVLLALYAAHARGQLHQMAERNTRALDIAARQIETVLDNARTTLKNLTNDLAYTQKYDERQPYLALHYHSGELTGSWDETSTPRVELHRERARLLMIVEKSGTTADKDSGAHIACTEHGRTDSTEGAADCISFEVDLSRMLGDVPLDRTFDVLLIADETGAVIEQIPLDRDGVHRLKSARGSGVRLRRLDEVATRNGSALKWEELTRGSQRLEVELVGESYELYTQPFRLEDYFGEDRVKPRTETWLLGGLVVSGYPFERALTVASWIPIAVGALLLVGLLSWPFLKLAFATKRQRVRASDAYLLVFAGFAGLMTAAIFFLDVESYNGLYRDFERRLETLAKNLSSNLRTELSELRWQLLVYDDLVSCAGNISSILEQAEGNRELWIAERLKGGLQIASSQGGESRCGRRAAGWHCNVRPFPGKSPLPDILEPRSFLERPYFTSVFWAQADGWQIAKATVEDENTPPVKLDVRDYFQAVQRNRLWLFGHPDGAEKPVPAYVQPFLSLTTGERHSALSLRSGLSDCTSRCPAECPVMMEERKQTVMAAISAAPISVTSPVLPAGFGFAVIDDEGNVLYHSDERRALQETIFDEVSDPKRLRSIQRSREAFHFETLYRAHPHQMYVYPIDGFPSWSVVTFYDLELHRTVNFEVLAHSLMLVTFYCGTLVLVLLLFRALRGTQLARLWPDMRKGGTYRLRATAMSGLIALGLAAVLWLDGWWLIASACLLPFIAGTICIYRLHPSEEDPEEGTALGHYAWAGATLFLAVGVVPAALIFVAVWQDTLGLYQRHEMLDYTEAIQRRNCGIEEESKKIALGPTREDFLRHRREETLDLYGDFTVIRASGVRPAHQVPRGLFRWSAFTRNLPVYNELSGHLRYLGVGEARDGSWRFTNELEAQNRSRVRRLGLERDLSECGEPVQIVSSLNNAGAHPWIGIVFSIIALGLALRRAVMHAARRIFFGDIDPACRPASVSELLSHERSIALVNTEIDRRALVSAVTTEVGDGPHAPWVVDRLDSEVVNSDRRQHLLAELESQVASGRQIVLVTAVDPMLQLFGEHSHSAGATPRSPEVTELPEEESERWTQVLAEFSRVPVSPALGEDERRSETNWPFLWKRLSTDEKLVLTQLAQEGFVNPRQRRAVCSVLQRGLLARRPALRIASPSFEAFIGRADDPHETMLLEEQHQGIGWKELRWVFGLVLGALAVFLFATERSLFESALGYLTVGGASVGAIFRALDTFQSGRKLPDVG